LGKLWEKYWKIMGQIMGKLWGNDGKMMGQ
jgi:hypothetical protein